MAIATSSREGMARLKVRNPGRKRSRNPAARNTNPARISNTFCRAVEVMRPTGQYNSGFTPTIELLR